LKRVAWQLARLCVGGGLLVLLFGLLGEWFWLLDLLNHFRVPLLITAPLGLGMALLARRWRLVALGAVQLVWLAVDVAPLYLADDPPTGTPLIVEVYNVNRTAGDPVRVARQLAASDADVIGLLEVDAGWFAALKAALTRWPHRLERHRADNFGLALYSRHPMTAKVAHPSEYPIIQAEVHLPNQAVGVALVHPPPPVSKAAAAVRDRAFEAYGVPLDALPPKAMLMGDFNATPWSRPLKALLHREKLREARDLAGAGLQGTWIAGTALPTWLPIDHVLVRGLGVTQFERLDENGSDHRPVRAALVVPE
jgi:endonuclease/exonuclease/phosphatase (EEP) superfamily protein YafD